METVPNETTNADAKARLKDEFPDWSIIHTDRGRWWATRGPLTRAILNRVADVSADTPEGLADRIREATRGE
ncbi:hypothetical protein [Actinomadura sp. WMMA1423]|uniref:hypothetical protein n=1 Tax=Actinomadura sp. WMMA1423 TaxID=2591108 RepID=UPI001146BB5A|nr:hypothetical protein [Actinomadura sp. WMMA1423]